MFTTTPPSRRPGSVSLLRALFLSSLIGGLLSAGTAGAQTTSIRTPKVSLEGEIEVWHEDRTDGSLYHHYLKTPKGRIKLKLNTSHKQEHQTGDRVRVTGVQIGETLALDGDANSIEPLARIAPNTFGAQNTLVLLVNFQDNPVQPYTPAYTENIVFNSTSSFHYENSYQQTWLTGDVRGWYTLPLNSTTCSPTNIAVRANEAAAANGIDVTTYTHILYVFPQNNACGWLGLGTVGGSPQSYAFINGTPTLRVVGHETGHNLGLFHSHSLDCGDVAIASNCQASEYGDTVDIMGASPSGHFNSFQKEWLGWLGYGSSPPITTAEQDGLYSIDTYEAVGSNPKAVKILKATNPATGYRDWYYLEYRQATGYDGIFSGNSNILNGLVIHTGSESTMDSSYLLDFTPTTFSWNDPALAVGQSFYDADAGVTITVVSADGTGATVSVTHGAGGTTDPPPTDGGPTDGESSLNITVSTKSPVYPRKKAIPISVNVTSSAMPVAKANVKLTITKPDGTVVYGSATTKKTGLGVLKYRTTLLDPVGTYWVSADIAPAGTLSGLVSTSFIVQ